MRFPITWCSSARMCGQEHTLLLLWCAYLTSCLKVRTPPTSPFLHSPNAPGSLQLLFCVYLLYLKYTSEHPRQFSTFLRHRGFLQKHMLYPLVRPRTYMAPILWLAFFQLLNLSLTVCACACIHTHQVSCTLAHSSENIKGEQTLPTCILPDRSFSLTSSTYQVSFLLMSLAHSQKPNPSMYQDLHFDLNCSTGHKSPAHNPYKKE